MVDPKDLTAMVPCSFCGGRAFVMHGCEVASCPRCAGLGRTAEVLLRPQLAYLSGSADLRTLLCRSRQVARDLVRAEVQALARGEQVLVDCYANQRIGLVVGAVALEHLLTAACRVPVRRPPLRVIH